MDTTVPTTLAELAGQIGADVEGLDFQVRLEGGRTLAAADVDLSAHKQPDASQNRIVDFAALGLDAPTAIRDFWGGETLEFDRGRLHLNLAPHASALLCW